MKVLYLHDYPFRVNKNGEIGFEVGMPITYFDRFTNAGASVEILSRKTETMKGCFTSSNNIKMSKYSSYGYFGILMGMLHMKFDKPDYDLYVVNYPSITGLVFLSLFNSNCQYIIEHVNDDNSFSSKSGGAFITYLLKIGKKRFFSRAYGVTCVAKYLFNQFYPSKYLIASNVNISVPEYIQRKKTTPIKLISVGAISKKKGIDLAIERVKELEIDCEYYIVGGEGDLDFRELSSTLPENIKVFHLGMLDERMVFEYLNNAHIFIQPSRSEGLPRALIEGMAHSLPAITSTLPCFSGLIDPVYMIDWAKQYSLKSAINSLLESNNYECQSIKNHNTSLAFDQAILNRQKAEFYSEVFHELYDSRES